MPRPPEDVTCGSGEAVRAGVVAITISPSCNSEVLAIGAPGVQNPMMRLGKVERALGTSLGPHLGSQRSVSVQWRLVPMKNGVMDSSFGPL